MLNEKLFRAIAHVFNETPRIVNEDIPARVKLPPPLVSFLPTTTPIPLKDFNGLPYIDGGEEYVVNCPRCGDTRHRLYFSHMWGTVIDACGQKYECSKHLFRCFNEDCQKNKDFSEKVIKSISKVLEDPVTLSNVDLSDVSTPVESELSDQVPLPPNMADIEHPSVPDYVRNYWYNVRGFGSDTLKAWGVKIAYLPFPIKHDSKLLEQPVTIIPVNQYGHYWWYQARLIPVNGKPELGYERNAIGEEYPKYYIPRGARKSWTLYNLDNALSYQEVAIVEGVTDVWRIGNRAMCKFGKGLSAAQRSVLERMFSGKDILIVPDQDDPQAMDVALKDKVLLENAGCFGKVRISLLSKGTDPGDLRLSSEDVWDYLQNNIIEIRKD